MKITGIILSGGMSRRMGTDKAFVRIEGKPMIQHVIDHVEPLCDQILISANQKRYESLGFPVVYDVILDSGPAGGIVSCLSESSNEKNLVISCDLPFASTEFLKELLALSENYEITVPEIGPVLQPLCGIYERRICKKMTYILQNGERAMRNVLNAFRLRRIGQKDLPAFDFYKELENINEKKDLG